MTIFITYMDIHIGIFLFSLRILIVVDYALLMILALSNTVHFEIPTGRICSPGLSRGNDDAYYVNDVGYVDFSDVGWGSYGSIYTLRDRK